VAWRKKMRAFTEKEVMPFVHAWCATLALCRSADKLDKR
jgi:hypothetical protein